MKVVSIVGTRPNLIKECSLNAAFRRRGVREVLVHTGQHYDFEMSGVFFGELEIPAPDYQGDINAQRSGERLGQMIQFVEDVLLKEAPRVCIVTGDVDSTTAGALAAAKHAIPVVHIEAGIRTSDLFNPEEINRRVADTIAELLLTNCQSAAANLRREGYDEARIVNTGDLMKDTLDRFSSGLRLPPEQRSYVGVTIHRQENTDNREQLRQIIEALIECEMPIRFPVHPRTRKKILEFGFWDALSSARHIELMAPVSYVEFLKLLGGAKKMVTDSGGVRREAYLMGVPVVNCSTLVWFPEILDAGWKCFTGPDKAKILDALRNFSPQGERPEIFGDGHAADRIVDVILQRYA
jgi:UDP-GlcNAc3NAcA epimerase